MKIKPELTVLISKLFLSCVYIFTNVAFSQNQKLIDSLETLFQKKYSANTDSIFLQKNEWTQKCDILFELSKAYWHNNPSQASYYAHKSLKEAKKYNYYKGIGNAYHSLGIIDVSSNNYLGAISFIKKSLQIRQKIIDLKGISGSYNLLGFIYENQNNHESALYNYLKALEILLELDEKLYIATVKSEIGVIYFKQKNFLEAEKYNIEALNLYQELSNENGKATIFQNLGKLRTQQKKYQKAYQYYQKSFLINKQMGNTFSMTENLESIGQNYLHQKKYKKAIHFCSLALKAVKNIKTIESEKEICNCLYKAYKATNNLNKSISYLEKFILLKDSLKKGEVSKKLLQIEHNKQILEDSLKYEKQKLSTKLSHEKEIHKRQNNRNIILGFSILILIIALSSLYRLNYTKKAKKVLQIEKDRSEELLLNILPAEIAEELKVNGSAEAKNFNLASILFTDFKSFTQKSQLLSPEELVNELNICFKSFDEIIGKYNIEKIKTIGDAYMAAGGLPKSYNASVKDTVMAALEMQNFIINRQIKNMKIGKPYFEMRVGIHTGPVVAGIVGVKKFQYDIWGDTVNTASRMESCGNVRKVNISEATYQILKNDPEFTFQNRGEIKVKGKGYINMFFVSKKIDIKYKVA